MADKIGMGVIGAGFMGMLHARALAQLADVRVVAVSDPAVEKAPKLLGQDEPLKLYADHQPLLAHKDIQAVVIATTLEDADAIIGAADKHKVKLMLAHLLRYDIRYAQIKSAVDQWVKGWSQEG